METRVVEVRNGLKFSFSVPTTADEYIAAANRGPTALLDDALDNNIYRSGLPDVWDQLAKALLAEHKVPKLTKPHPKAEKAAKGETVVAETDPAYVERVAAQVADGKATTFQSIVDTFGVVPLDLTERRGQGGQLIGKGDLEMAATYLDAGVEKCTAALKKIAAVTGEDEVKLTGEREVDQKAVALAIKAYRTAAAKNLLK